MLEIRNLTIRSRGGLLLEGVSLSLNRGEALGLTGPSGAGKTTLLKSVLGLPDSDYAWAGGCILADGQNLGELSSGQRRSLCGKVFGFIPQNPMTAFDSRLTIEAQLVETIRLHLGLAQSAARGLAREKLAAVNLPEPERVLRSRAGQLSGGMLQRVAMALVLALKPRYILADEPTAALDEENRNLLLSLLRDQLRNSGLLLITHDRYALASLCRRGAVLYGGRLIEEQGMEDLFAGPRQPWTREFVRCSKASNEGVFRWTHWKD